MELASKYDPQAVESKWYQYWLDNKLFSSKPDGREPFRVHILGCGSATPTLKHNCSSQIVEVRGKCFMVDCGEGTQTQLRLSRIKFTRLSAVFISHLHGDHCFGLIGLISTFGMLGRTAPLHIYAPAGFEPMLNAMLEMFCQGLEYEVVFHGVESRDRAHQSGKCRS